MLKRFYITIVCFIICIAGHKQLSADTDAFRSFQFRIIHHITLEGNRKVEDAAIFANLISKTGDRLSSESIRKDIKTLWGMDYFNDIRVYVESVKKQKVVLKFVFEEKPSLRKVFISGNSEVELSDINDVLDLKKNSILNLTKVKENQKKIRALYKEKGYYLATLEHQIRPINDVEVDVWYLIKERSKVEVKEITFVGNNKISDQEILSVIQTKPGNFLSFLTDSGVFSGEVFQRDLLIITAYYYDRGFIDLKIGEPNVQLSRDRQDIYVSVPITEGKQYTVGTIDFDGDIGDDKTSDYGVITLKEGKLFSRSDVGKTIKQVVNFYRNQGYAYADLKPITKKRKEAEIVDLTFRVKKGKKVYYERINIVGHTTTRDKVIRREINMLEGELYSQAAVDLSRQRITALGFFESVDISTQKGNSDDLIEITVEVKERKTGGFQFGVGFSSAEGIIAQTQISQENLLGHGHSLSLSLQFSGLRQLFSLRFVEPHLLDTDWTFATNLYNQVSAYDSFSRTSTGGDITFGRFLNYRTRAFLTYKIESVEASNRNAGLFSLSSPSSRSIPTDITSVANLFRGGLTSSARVSFRYDSRNNRLFPSDGIFQDAFFEIADDFLFSENIFTRYGGFIRYYRKLFGNFVLKLNADVGVITSRDPLGVPITERYLIGGIYDIRGFQPRSLGPLILIHPSGEDAQSLISLPLGGNLKFVWNSEIEFPILQSLGVSGVVFFDSGNSYNLESRYCNDRDHALNSVSEKYNPCFRFPESFTSGLRFSAGFGLRWQSPIGPLRFEWGIPLDRQPHEDPIVFEFAIGNFL